MLCIVQLSQYIQRLAFSIVSNLINDGSSILFVDELVSCLGLTIFATISNSINGGSSIQLHVDELVRSLRLTVVALIQVQLLFQNLYAAWHQVQEKQMEVFRSKPSSPPSSLNQRLT